MFTSLHPLADLFEQVKVDLLRGDEGIFLKVGEDCSRQFAEVSDFELERVVRSVGADGPTTPTLLENMEDLGPISILADREARSDLPTESVSHAWLEGDTEATFSIHESGNVGVEIQRHCQGRRIMAPRGAIQGPLP